MLHLMGIGYKKEHLSIEMLEILKNADQVYLEYYTSFYGSTFEELEELIGKRITICDREVIESKIEDVILKPAKNASIVLMVIGDPLIATTHTDLLLRSEDLEVETQVYHNVSIANFIARTGLQFYKFGKITSIPFFSEKFMPRTPFMVYLDNHKMGAHSLFLLDLNPSNDISNKGHDKYLTAGKSLQFLLDIPKIMIENEEIEEKDGLAIDKEDKAIICSKLGHKDETIIYGSVKDLIEFDVENKLKEPLCLIIPGDLHEMEENYLSQFKISKFKTYKG
jgi:diphthine synthase